MTPPAALGAVRVQRALGQQTQGRFQIHAGRPDGLVTEDVGDLLDRCAVLHQPGRQRVSERMHAVAAFLADRDMSRPGVLDQNLMQMVLVGERADRGGVAEEHLRAVADRTAMTGCSR